MGVSCEYFCQIFLKRTCVQLLCNLIFGIQQGLLSLTEVSSLSDDGNFYPALLLCLKELENLKGQVR